MKVKKSAVHTERERALQARWVRACSGLRRQLSWAFSGIRTKAGGLGAYGAKRGKV